MRQRQSTSHQNSDQPISKRGRFALLILAGISVLFAAIALPQLLGNMQEAPNNRAMYIATPLPPSSPVSTSTSPVSPTVLHIATPLPPATMLPDATTDVASEAPDVPVAAIEPTSETQSVTATQAISLSPLASPLITITPRNAIAPTAAPSGPQMVSGQAIALGQSDPGNWQTVTDGNTTYQLPEGAEEGEALGEMENYPSIPANEGVVVEIQSNYGEDCGIAAGNTSDFTLLRLRPAGESETDLLLDRWQGDNYATPPAARILQVNSSRAGTWHRLGFRYSPVQPGNSNGELTYSLDDQTDIIDVTMPTNSKVYLYAGGGGCSYRLGQ